MDSSKNVLCTMCAVRCGGFWWGAESARAPALENTCEYMRTTKTVKQLKNNRLSNKNHFFFIIENSATKPNRTRNNAGEWGLSARLNVLLDYYSSYIYKYYMRRCGAVRDKKKTFLVYFRFYFHVIIIIIMWKGLFFVADVQYRRIHIDFYAYFKMIHSLFFFAYNENKNENGMWIFACNWCVWHKGGLKVN